MEPQGGGGDRLGLRPVRYTGREVIVLSGLVALVRGLTM